MSKVKEIHRIYKLKLLESMPVGRNINITRVPGGWVFSNMQGCTFIPYDNEFMGHDCS